jgi:hypothetical protein
MMKTISRENAVARIRERLVALQEPGKSMCRIAAERNILCRGFEGDDALTLRWRYAGKIPAAPHLSRGELQDFANAWQLNRQRSAGTALCCDAQYMFYETCRGWDDFSNEEIAQFFFELTGEKVSVAGAVKRGVL